MQRKRKIFPAQRDSKGELHFWQPYIKGCVVVDHSQAQLEMNQRFGRTPAKPAEVDTDERISDAH